MKIGFRFAANGKKISYIIKISFKQGHMPHLPLRNSGSVNAKRKEQKGLV